jgi:hypothetical protein
MTASSYREAKDFLGTLIIHNCVKPSYQHYIKTEAFMVLLREMQNYSSEKIAGDRRAWRMPKDFTLDLERDK